MGQRKAFYPILFYYSIILWHPNIIHFWIFSRIRSFMVSAQNVAKFCNLLEGFCSPIVAFAVLQVKCPNSPPKKRKKGKVSRGQVQR